MKVLKKHDKKLGICAADLVKIRFRVNEMSILEEVRNELEQILLDTSFFDEAPFEWITLSLRFGLMDEVLPHYEKISKRYGDLPLAIELDSHKLQNVSCEKLKNKFIVATLKSLIHAGDKYGLPTEVLKNHLDAAREMGD